MFRRARETPTTQSRAARAPRRRSPPPELAGGAPTRACDAPRPATKARNAGARTYICVWSRVLIAPVIRPAVTAATSRATSALARAMAASAMVLLPSARPAAIASAVSNEALTRSTTAAKVLSGETGRTAELSCNADSAPTGSIMAGSREPGDVGGIQIHLLRSLQHRDIRVVAAPGGDEPHHFFDGVDLAGIGASFRDRTDRDAGSGIRAIVAEGGESKIEIRVLRTGERFGKGRTRFEDRGPRAIGDIVPALHRCRVGDVRGDQVHLGLLRRH